MFLKWKLVFLLNIFFLAEIEFYMKNCSAWLRLKLNTKMGLNHPTTPPHPTTRNFWKGSRHSRRLRFGMLASLKLRNRTHTHSPHPPTKSEHLTLSLGEGGNFKSKVIPSWTLSTWVLFMTSVGSLLNETKCHLVSFSLVANQTKWHLVWSFPN